ncbi:MAG TPA: hypothetical protein VFP68_10480 [Burkholderiaceae bacterium]|nr:hypothetical protein [Burkholderiaceae bacterium]
MKEDKPLAKGETRTSANRDPLTGAPGSHPVGTATGAVAGGLAAGAAAGSVAGPVGTAVGAAVGAVLGGLAGHGIAELVDPTAEDLYWRENYSTRPYIDSVATYDEYGPAYRYGVDAYTRNPRRAWNDVESDLAGGWNTARGSSSLTWDRARMATRDAWDRVSDKVERAIPGDSDGDGR